VTDGWSDIPRRCHGSPLADKAITAPRYPIKAPSLTGQREIATTTLAAGMIAGDDKPFTIPDAVALMREVMLALEAK
jgi:hypothetical protein